MSDFTTKNERRKAARATTYGGLLARRVRTSLQGAYGREPVAGIRNLANGCSDHLLTSAVREDSGRRAADLQTARSGKGVYA